MTRPSCGERKEMVFSIQGSGGQIVGARCASKLWAEACRCFHIL